MRVRIEYQCSAGNWHLQHVPARLNARHSGAIFPARFRVRDMLELERLTRKCLPGLLSDKYRRVILEDETDPNPVIFS
jgi:hypothetical protein